MTSRRETDNLPTAIRHITSLVHARFLERQSGSNGMPWDVWLGPRGDAGLPSDADLLADPDALVISYVPKSTANTFDGDLKAFLTDAQGRSAAVTEELLVSDVFFGFEVWSGGLGLSVDTFIVDVKK